jgi:outer membrane protein TolC
LHTKHLDVMRALSATVRARVVTGATTLADQQQIDLTAARVEDAVASMVEAERSAEAQLRAAVGSAAGLTSLPTAEAPPDAALPIESEEVLTLAARSHPDLAARDFSAEAQESKARAEEANALPGFSVGADWIITGRAEGAGPADSGKDAVMVGAGIRLPVWQGHYADAADAARAEAHVERADRRAATDRALAELASSLSAVRDAARRVQLYTYTLLPQAESAYSSILGAYTSGRGSVAQALLSQRDLLELRIARVRARADHARAWARLEQVTGKPLERRSTPPVPPVPNESEHDHH